jgi:NDP-sugar pyrophosphorylase family protein
MIKQAVVLAAGFGERLRPLTEHMPKPLFPWWGQPILGRLFVRLAGAGIARCWINIHHLPKALMAFLNTYPRPGALRVGFSYEPQILGTGGALAQLKPCLDEVFLLYNADIIAEFDIRAFWRAHQSYAQAWATLAVLPAGSNDGQIFTYKNRIVSLWHPPYQPWDGDSWYFSGISILEKKLLDMGQPLAMDRAYCWLRTHARTALAGGYPLYVYPIDGYCSDIGTPSGYFNAHKATWSWFQQELCSIAGSSLAYSWDSGLTAHTLQHVAFSGFCAVGRRVQIGTAVELQDCIVLDDAVVPAQTRAKNTLFHPKGRLTFDV